MIIQRRRAKALDYETPIVHAACKVCGEPFTAAPRALYCGLDCRKEAERLRERSRRRRRQLGRPTIRGEPARMNGRRAPSEERDLAGVVKTCRHITRAARARRAQHEPLGASATGPTVDPVGALASSRTGVVAFAECRRTTPLHQDLGRRASRK